MKKLCAILLAALSISCSAESGSRSQIVAEPFSNDKIEAQIDSIYHAMTLDERIAQMGSMRSNQLMEDGKLSLELCRKHIPHGIGHIAQFAISQDFTPEELRQFVADLQDYLVKHTRTGLPAIFHEEAITGFSTKGATTYPQQIGVSATWNPALVSLKSEYTRESMRSYGATMALSPMVDVVRSQHFNRVEEGYGEDGYLTSVLGDAFIRGLQGDDLRTGVATCTKHFLGYGGGISLPEKEVMEEIITPHEVGIKVSGNKSIMPGYHSFKDETAITNHYFIKELLRDYLAFDGVIVSDYFAIGIKWAAKGNPNHFIDRAEKALNAGADTELCDLEAFLNIPQLLKDGRVSEERIEEAVKSNLRMKARLGLLDANPVFMDDKALELDAPKYRQLAYDLASQGVVLLKNDGTLPLNTAKPKVALVGPNANSIWAMLGDYTYQAHHTFFQGKQADVEATKVYTLKEGLEQALGGEFKLSHERGCSWDGHERNKAEAGGDARIKNEKILAIEKMLEETSDPTSWSRAIKLAGKSDVVIAAMGEHILSCGEGRNRKGIRMPGEQEAFVEELIDSKTPVVVVLFGGRAQLLSEKIRNGAAAILHAW
ncbi:MAG: glycoside hydrolase family 3 N-terminal domain-containing protein, partial [Rikenellaceae bacterium]